MVSFSASEKDCASNLRIETQEGKEGIHHTESEIKTMISYPKIIIKHKCLLFTGSRGLLVFFGFDVWVFYQLPFGLSLGKLITCEEFGSCGKSINGREPGSDT